jgi:outer membrane biogenesis lipoprotein LolB
MKKFQRTIILLLCVLTLHTIQSCKSKKAVVSIDNNKEISVDNIIKNAYKNDTEFNTLYIKSSIRYESEKQSQNLTAEIKIKKNEIILVSIRFLGITMAKAIITPDEVKYYEKLGSSYFEGNYAILSKFLGTDLDFNKVQNLLIGKPIDDLQKGKFDYTIQDNRYKLEDNSQKNTTKICYVETDKFLVGKQEIIEKEFDRSFQIEYQNYSPYSQVMLPSSLIINAQQKNEKTKINIDYNTITINEELSFPYNTPEGYKRVFIN